MISKRALRTIQRETRHKKDIISSLALLIVGIYLFVKEYGYIDMEINYFSLIVLIIGILLFIRNLSH